MKKMKKLIKTKTVLTNKEVNLVNGAELCDCYCYTSSKKDSKIYTQLPHPERCRNYCLMHDLQYHKCVYIQAKQYWPYYEQQ
jgi:hypothetical protein